MNDFLAASENTLSSVRKTVTARLGLWLNPRIDLATSASDFDLRELRTRPMSIYLGVTPDNLERLAPLLNLFFQQVVDLNTRELPERNPALNRQLLLLLDEFPALGHVGVLAKGVAFVAGYGIRLLTILQSPSQLRAIYGPDAAKSLMTNHAVEVVFTPKEQDVANELSDRFGYDTVKARSRSRPWGFSAGRTQSETVSDGRRALMLPQELKLAPRAKTFLLMAGIPPVYADKVVYFSDRQFKARLVRPPTVKPIPEINGPNVVVMHEIRQLKAAVQELRATAIRRPMTDEEILNPSSIPDGAITLDFADVELDLSNLPLDEIKRWTMSYIDRQVEDPRAA